MVTQGITLYAKWTENDVGINKVETLSLSIYPNPASNFVTISGFIEGENIIRITDLSGRRIIQTEIHNSETTIDISGLSSGVYIVITGKRNMKMIVRN